MMGAFFPKPAGDENLFAFNNYNHLEPQPCEGCAAKDKRIAELESIIKQREKLAAESIEMRENRLPRGIIFNEPIF